MRKNTYIWPQNEKYAKRISRKKHGAWSEFVNNALELYCGKPNVSEAAKAYNEIFKRLKAKDSK